MNNTAIKYINIPVPLLQLSLQSRIDLLILSLSVGFGERGITMSYAKLARLLHTSRRNICRSVDKLESRSLIIKIPYGKITRILPSMKTLEILSGSIGDETVICDSDNLVTGSGETVTLKSDESVTAIGDGMVTHILKDNNIHTKQECVGDVFDTYHSVNAEFEKFWNRYPRKIGKSKALQIKDNPDTVRQHLKQNQQFIKDFGNYIWTRANKLLDLSSVAKWIEKRAKEGCRIIAVDPITIVDSGNKPWIDDKYFVNDLGKIATDNQCSIVLVTHPVKTVSFPDMTQLAGSSAYSRFTQNIIWLQAHDSKESEITNLDGNSSILHNRTLHILKTRNGKGSGKQIAMNFNTDNLRLDEFGLITSTQSDNFQQDLNHRTELRFKTAQAKLKETQSKERIAREKRLETEISEKEKTKRIITKAQSNSMLPIKLGA